MPRSKKADKYTLLKRNIIKLLNDKGIKENIDEELVDELIFNYRLVDKVKEDMLQGEYMTQVRKDENYPLMMVSAQTAVYNNALKNIMAISRQLGITPAERTKLKLNSAKSDDNDGF